MSSSLPIGIFDSGIGGLTVANAIVDLLPAETMVYVGDTAHVPYGGKPAELIQEYCRNISSFLLKQQCKAIVVACNTATAAALHHLRTLWPDVPFIGMEPAVKPAALSTRTGVVGVLATRGTFSSERYAALMHRYAANVQVLQDPCIGLVELIEAGKTEAPETEAFLRAILQPMLRQGADTFVLGCTHYPLVRPLIENIVGPKACIIDPAPAVARRLAFVLQQHHIAAEAGKTTPVHHFFVSGNPDTFSASLQRFFIAQYELQHQLIF